MIEFVIEDKNTINILVATATCGGNKNNRIIVGTIREPPPIPNSPEQNPTAKQIIMAMLGLNPYIYCLPSESVYTFFIVALLIGLLLIKQ